jgi:hypothetical protein
MAGIAITHVRDGKVMSDWGEFDLLGLMQQLGVAPGPPGGRPPSAAGNGDRPEVREAPEGEVHVAG